MTTKVENSKDKIDIFIHGRNRNKCKAFWNRLTTKDQFKKRGIITSNYELSCALCFQVEENMNHLFFHCKVTKRGRGEFCGWRLCGASGNT